MSPIFKEGQSKFTVLPLSDKFYAVLKYLAKKCKQFQSQMWPVILALLDCVMQWVDYLHTWCWKKLIILLLR